MAPPTELKLTLTVPYSGDAPDDNKVNTSRMENSGLLRGLKDQATITSKSDHEAEFTFPTAGDTAHKFAERFLKAKQGFLYDFDNNPNNGKSEVVTENTVIPITDAQITKLVAAVRTSKKNPTDGDFYSFFKSKADLTLEQFQLIKSSGVYDAMLAHEPSFNQAADQLLRAYNQRLKNPVAIRYWDDDSNLATLNDLYWVADTAYTTAQPKLSALAPATPTAATAPTNLSESLKPISDDMKSRTTNFTFQALLVPTGVADDNQVQRVPLDDKMVAQNFRVFSKNIEGHEITIDKTTYRLPIAAEIAKFKMDHMGATVVGDKVYHIGDDNLRTAEVKGLHIPLLVVHESQSKCSTEKQSSYSANYNTGEYATLEFSISPELESDFFALVGAAPQAACVIERDPTTGKRTFRISRTDPKTIGGTLSAIDEALAMRAAGTTPTPKNVVPTEHEVQVARAYELFADFRPADIAEVKQALQKFKELVASMVEQGEKPPKRENNHGGIMGLGLPVALEGLLLAAFLGVGGWFTHLLTKTDGFASVWQKMRSNMGYIPDYLENWHKKALNFTPYDCSVGNREQVIRRIMEALANFEAGVSRSVMLIGESAQGKTHMMKEIARRIALWRDYEDKIAKGLPAEKPTEYLNPALKTSVFYAIDFEKMGSEISLLGSWDHRVVHFKAWMKIRKDAVLYGDEATKMLGLGEVTTPDKKEGRRDLMNKIKEPVADGEYAMVFSTTRAEFEQHFVPYDPSQATLRRLHLVDIQTYTVPQVKQILRNLGAQMVSPDGLFKIDDAAIDRLVDKLIENGTQEFLLLNTAKNMLIDVANRMREAIRLSTAPEESEANIDEDMRVYTGAAAGIDEALKQLLARKRQVQIEMHNLNNLISQTSVLHIAEMRELRSRLAALADEYLEINAQIVNLTGPAVRKKIRLEIHRVWNEIKRVRERRSATPHHHVRMRINLALTERRLYNHLKELHRRFKRLAKHAPDRRIVITAEMALAEEARQRKLSGNESHDSLVTEATALRQSIRAALLELRKYGHHLTLGERADTPMDDGESMADVVIRLKRLFEAIVTYNTRVATNHNMPKAERVAGYETLATLVSLSGFDPALDTLPAEEVPEEAPRPQGAVRPATATPPPPPPVRPGNGATAPAAQPAALRPAPKIVSLPPSDTPPALPPAKPKDPNGRAGQTHRSAPTTTRARSPVLSPVGANPSVRPAATRPDVRTSADASRRGTINDIRPAAAGPQCAEVLYEGGVTYADGSNLRVAYADPVVAPTPPVGANPSVRPTSARPHVPTSALRDMSFTDFIKALYNNNAQAYEAVLSHTPDQQLKDILLRMKALAKTDPAIKALYDDVSLTYDFIKAFNHENPGFFKEPEAMLNLFVRSRFKDAQNPNLRTLTADQFVAVYATRREAELQATRRVERETLALRGNLRRGMERLEHTLREAERIRRR